MHSVVLCVDKREANLAAERTLLEAAGFEVLTAQTRAQIAEILSEQFADIALVSDDLDHGEQETCAAIRQLQPYTTIVLQRASFTRSEVPAETDVVIAKTTSPKEKLRLLGSLLIKRAA